MKPLLSGTLTELSQIKYPVLCTPKIDGIRCLIVDGVPVSRSLKPIPNRYIRESITEMYGTWDGEIVLNFEEGFNAIQSAVMSEEGEPEFSYLVFDDWNCPIDTYTERVQYLKEAYAIWKSRGWHFAMPLLPTEVNNEQEFLEVEQKFLQMGAEGVMVRSPNGVYKFGRSTLSEGYLLKWKRFVDGEAQVTGFIEEMSNTNPKTTNRLGHAERASCKGGMRAAGTLGSLMVTELKTGVKFNIGTGFDADIRKEIWDNQDKYINKIVKYKSQPHGSKDKPRFPVFLGFRSRDDMS